MSVALKVVPPLMVLLPMLLEGCVPATPAASAREDGAVAAAPREFRAVFLRSCDLATAEFHKPIEPFRPHDRDYDSAATHHMPAFEDAHAVRAIAVAYDLSGDRKYLDACRRWADWAVECQEGMIPRGAYYMNHSRAPGEDRGQWNAADSGTVGMGVLATAVRCDDPAERRRYLDSVRGFLKLMTDNWVDEEGGIANGLWPLVAAIWLRRRVKARRNDQIQSEVDRQIASQNKR